MGKFTLQLNFIIDYILLIFYNIVVILFVCDKPVASRQLICQTLDLRASTMKKDPSGSWSSKCACVACFVRDVYFVCYGLFSLRITCNVTSCIFTFTACGRHVLFINDVIKLIVQLYIVMYMILRHNRRAVLKAPVPFF